ncbi:MAG: redoxin family protein, partial [Pontibacterium sp.]
MRKVILFLPLVIFIVLGGFLYSAIGTDPTVLPSAKLNKPVPAFALPSVYDQSVQLTEASLKGEPALLNVWATWCPSCKEEHAQLNQIKAEGYKVYGINYKDDQAKAKIWL